MRAFDDFVKRKLIEQFTDIFTLDIADIPDKQTTQQAPPSLPNN